ERFIVFSKVRIYAAESKVQENLLIRRKLVHTLCELFHRRHVVIALADGSRLSKTQKDSRMPPQCNGSLERPPGLVQAAKHNLHLTCLCVKKRLLRIVFQRSLVSHESIPGSIEYQEQAAQLDMELRQLRIQRDGPLQEFHCA